ncbi:glycosyltransferase [Haloferax elongans]|nr:glycosyltransferase [Haloferax elongans]
MDSRHIAIFANSLRLGGAERVALNLANGFANTGHNVDLVLVSEQGELLSEVDESVSVVDLGAERVLRSLAPLRGYLSTHRPDVVISIGAHVNLVSVWGRLTTMASPTLLLTEHSIMKRMPDERKASLMKVLARVFYPLSDCVVAVSQGVLDELRSEVGYRGNAEVVYNPIVSEQLLRDAEEPLEHPWFDSKTPVVLGAGRLAPEKDFPTLIRAFDRLTEKRDARLVITGAGPERDTLEQLVKSRGLEESVEFAGFVDNVYKYMSNADVFVLSSLNEGFGMVIAEALACGTPVVSTDCPSGPAEILADGKYGSLVPVGDADQLSTAIDNMLANPTPEVVTRERAAAFSVESVIENYERVIEEL